MTYWRTSIVFGKNGDSLFNDLPRSVVTCRVCRSAEVDFGTARTARLAKQDERAVSTCSHLIKLNRPHVARMRSSRLAYTDDNGSIHRAKFVYDFPALTSAVEDGIRRRLHTGVQVFVSVDGEPVVDAGFGESSPGIPLSKDTIMPWRSAGKPLTAAALCVHFASGRLSPDSQLMEVLPEVKVSDADAITIGSLLSHSSALPVVETTWPHQSWEDCLQQICSRNLNVDSDVAYQPQATWFLLGQLLIRLDRRGRDFQTLVRDMIQRPVGMENTWCGIPTAVLQSHAHHLPTIYHRERSQMVESNFGSSPWLSEPSPGGNFRGPVRELGAFYEMLMRGGLTADGQRLIAEETVRLMTQRHREGMFDRTFQHVVDFGLGVIVNSNQYGVDTVPYGFGQFSSRHAFGHGGAQCAMGFCDPQHQLVVVWSANGFCGEGLHQQRNRRINEAIYTDLGLRQD